MYDLSSPEAGYRVLVDRLWPRGLKREAARTFTSCSRMSLPSEELRRWFGHDPARWEEFQARYSEELAVHSQILRELLQRCAGGAAWQEKIF